VESSKEVQFLKRMLLSTIGVGICQGCLDRTIPYAKERHQFGQPIASFGMVQSMLSEIATRTSTSRLLLYDAAAESQTDMKRRRDGELVAAYARESAMTAADLAVQIFGGYGYTKDYPVEMFFRDAKFLEAIPPSVSEAKCAAGELLVS
jgi:alkylation response protein AidB-like acyl-CoA dehydrogenase